MRYLSYLHDNNRRYGILEGDAVYEIRSPEPDLDGYILKGDLQTASEIKASSKPVPVSEVSLLSPFTRDMNMLCVGLNYWSHADEFSRSMQTSVQNDESIYFIKRTHDCLGDGQSLRSRLDLDPQCDYETELGVILAKELPPGSLIDQSVIFGFTIINDYTSRLFQKRYKQWSLGKSIDTYCAMGPVIATLDEFKDPFDLAIRGYKNNVLVQDSRTSLLRRGIFDVICDLNQGMTLHRCDV
ncbi:MAG: fumarylacetoacetate hydrolase family protein, partial [Spirochaetales bacterium]|nr:fumarylacetoacetate hydrolase family protein [Spirochaetales bacterium]